jgi:diguanylate cyclase (GGDEF)-like protein
MIDALVVHDENLNIVKFIEKNPKRLITVSLNDTVFDAYTLMRSVKIHYLIVVNEKDELEEVLKIDDLVSFLTEIAIKDDLTGLYNKRFFEFILDKYRNFDTQIGIIFVDIDKFKELNDKYGHMFGDKILKEVSDIIKGSVRDIDYAFRFGGDEFVVVSFVPREVAQKIAKRIKDKISSTVIEGIKISASVGWAHYKSDSDDIYEVVEIADKRMYEEKRG